MDNNISEIPSGKVAWKGSTLLAPLPFVLVSCGEGQNANLITVAWTGIVNSKPPMTYISLRPERHSFGIISETKEFVINLVSAPMVRAADICGVYSGSKVDKFHKCGLTPVPSSDVSCPSIGESPLSIECRVEKTIPLGSHTMFLAGILSVHADKRLISSDGRLHMEKADLALFTHGEYFATGKRLGRLGFAVKKKKDR